MDGARINIARSYNNLARRLLSLHDEGLLEIDEQLAEIIDELRMHIANTCLIYEEEDENFNDISEKIDFVDVIEKLGLDEENPDKDME